MKKERHLNGFSLTEMIVAAIFLPLIVLGIVKVLDKHVKMVHKTELFTNASALAEEVASRVKSQPFEHVFSFDSAKQDTFDPPRFDNPANNPLFKAEAYYIPLSTSPMKAELKNIVTKVKDSGFDQVIIDIVFLRRDSSAAQGGSVSDFIAWSKKNVAGTLENTDGCDYYDTKACFKDRNDDGDYFDVVDGKVEVPDTGFKMMTVTIKKNGGVVGTKTGTMLSKGGFSGDEIRSGQSPLKLKIVNPVDKLRVFQVTDHTRAALQLPSHLLYGPGFWPSRKRIDNANETVRLDQYLSPGGFNYPPLDLDGDPINLNFPQPVFVPGVGMQFFPPLPWTLITSSPESRYFMVYGETENGQNGMIQVYDQDGAVVTYPAGQFHEEVEIGDIQGAFFWIYNSGTRIFKILSGGEPPSKNYLMKDGVHRLYFRKRTMDNKRFSPYVTRIVYVDTGVPQLRQKFITEPIWPYGGKSPLNRVIVSDYFQSNGTPAKWASGIYKEVGCALVKNMNNGSISKYVVGGAGNRILDWSGNAMVDARTTTMTFTLVDGNNYPLPLADNTSYQVKWEWGDAVGYKNNCSYSFSIPSVQDDTTPPELIPRTTNYWGATRTIRKSTTADPFEVRAETLHYFYSLLFDDPESGINYKSLKIEVCPEAGPLPPIDPNAQTFGCKTIFNFNEGKKWSNAWGDNITYWDKAAHSLAQVQFSTYTVAGGFFDPWFFPINSVWRLRAYVKNWAGIATKTGDDDWKIKIVN